MMATFHRALSGGVFAALFCLGLFFNATQPLVPWIICIATAVGTLEFFKLAERKDFKAQGALACVIGVWTVVVGYHDGLAPISETPEQFHYGSMALILTVALLSSFALQLMRDGHDRFLAHVSITFLGCFYVSLPMAMGMEILHGPQHVDGSRFLFIFLILVVWSSDTGAYFVGRKWGRRKLAPKLSPGKTIEGCAGGLGATLLMAVTLKIVWPEVSNLFFWPEIVALALIFFFVGLVGDLCESALKRDAGVKDSGFNITGHGGMLDIIDSLLFCLPVFYLYMKYLYPALHG
jgi:phosphatidate cytidylyltransferase